ncbi:MAG TPA: hypothetical protein VK850_15175 [Candidatus Binatia bacterium]|nr:hypothetical protein [Candidatus Binatia bacterium]
MRSFILLLATTIALHAADLKLKTADAPPPMDLNPSIQQLLQPKAVQLLDGDKPIFQFWLVKELPGSKLDSLKPATLLGAVAVSKAQRDYRDDDLAAGVYTMRFALQPQDGNHLGSADFTTFAILTPAKVDTKPDGITDYKSLVKASSKETTTDHPVILSLRPTKGDAVELVEPAPEHKSVRVKIGSVPFEIVYEGKGHK